MKTEDTKLFYTLGEVFIERNIILACAQFHAERIELALQRGSYLNQVEIVLKLISSISHNVAVYETQGFILVFIGKSNYGTGESGIFIAL